MGKSVPLSRVSLLRERENGGLVRRGGPQHLFELRPELIEEQRKGLVSPKAALGTPPLPTLSWPLAILAIPFFHHQAGHALDALCPVVLIMCLPCHILQVLHVSTHQHCPQLHKVAVPWIFHCIARLGVSQGHGWGEPLRARRHLVTSSVLYLPRCPRGRAGLELAALWPLPRCCCQ